MDMYSKLKELNDRITASEERLNLLEIREEMRKIGALGLTDTQLATAIAPEPEPDPEPVLEGDDAPTVEAAVDEPEPAPHTPEKRGPGRPKRK